MKKKNRKQKADIHLKTAVLPAVFSICLLIYVLSAKTNLIIYYHVKGYQAIRNISLILCILFLGNLVRAIAQIMLKRRAENKELRQQLKSQSDQKYQKAKAEAYLSMSGKLDSSYIQKLLAEKADNEWFGIHIKVLSVKKQLEEMDQLQIRLSKLLTENGAEALNSTQEVLDEVEQYLCRNVRKCLNYMGAVDPQDAKDADLIEGKLDTCIADNKDKLEKIEEFIRTVVEFLNKQGEEKAENSISLLEMYKKTILESISGEKEEVIFK